MSLEFGVPINTQAIYPNIFSNLPQHSPIGRLSNGTMIAAFVASDDSDMVVAYSDDFGDTWTECATEIVGTFTTYQPGLWIDEFDKLWIWNSTSSIGLEVGIYSFDTDDITQVMAMSDVSYSGANIHSGTVIRAFEDPANATKMRFIIASLEGTTYFVKEHTVDKAGTNLSSGTTISTFTGSGNATQTGLTMRWSGDQKTPHQAGPDILWTYGGSIVHYYKLLTWGGSAYGAGTQYLQTTSNNFASSPSRPIWDDENSKYLVGGHTSSTASVWYISAAGDANGTQLGSNITVDAGSQVHLTVNVDRLLYLWSTDDSNQSLQSNTYDLTAGLSSSWSAERANGFMQTSAQIESHITSPINSFNTDGDSQHDIVFLTNGDSYRYLHIEDRWKHTSLPPVFRAAASNAVSASTGNGTLTINKPTGTVEGDLMLAFILMSDFSALTSGPTAATWNDLGPIKVGSFQSGYEGRWLAFYLIAGASEPSTYDFTWTGSMSANTGPGGVIVTYRPADSNHFFGAQPFAYGTNPWAQQYSPTTTWNNWTAEEMHITSGLMVDANIGRRAVGTYTKDSNHDAELHDADYLAVFEEQLSSVAVPVRTVTRSQAGEGALLRVVLKDTYFDTGGVAGLGWGWIPIGG